MAPGKDDGTLAVDVKANAPPGTYTIVLRSQAQIPYQKDPKAPKQDPNAGVIKLVLHLTEVGAPVRLAVLLSPDAAMAATPVLPALLWRPLSEWVQKIR